MPFELLRSIAHISTLYNRLDYCNPSGLRNAKTVGGSTKYFVYNGMNIVFEYEDSISDGTIYYYGLNRTHNSNGEIYVYNAHGDTVQLVKDNAVVVIYTYDAFGNLTSQTGESEHEGLLVSKHFIDLTKAYIENAVEYLPVDVVSEGIIIEEKYSAINVINVLDALDLDNSIYSITEKDDWKILNIKKYALKGQAIQGQHIFKLKDSVFPVFVSEVVKEIVQKNNLSGFDFSEVKVTY